MPFKDQFPDTEELYGFIQKPEGCSINQGFGKQEKTLFLKLVVLVCLGRSLGWYLEQGYWGFPCHIHHCYWTRKNKLVHFPGPWFAFISGILLCLLYVLCKLMNTKLDISWEERATSLCNWYKKLLLCDKHIEFGGFSAVELPLTKQQTPSLLRCCFFVNCYLSDSLILDSISLNFALQGDFCS